MHATSMSIRSIESAADFAALVHDWENLQKDAAVTSVFESFDWQHLWWQHYGKRAPLRLLVASAGGMVVGILPLWIQTMDMLRYPVRVLRFVGSGGDTFPDDLGPILAKGRESEVARALAEAVVRLRGWDVLLLQDMNPDNAFTQAMESVAREAWMLCDTGRSERIAFMELPATWDAWLGSLHRDKRYKIKNIRKKCNAAHPTRFFAWDDPATLDRGIDRLIALHNKRWEKAGQQHAFSTAEYRDFHRAVMKACMARDRLRLYSLELAGEIRAMYYFYKFRDRVYLMQSGFDPDFGNVKPGQVLLGHIIEHAIGEGHKVLDFLRGDHRYKDELATGERETVYLTAFRLRPGALVYRARRNLLPKLKAQLLQAWKRMRPPPPDPEKKEKEKTD
jgi:CelD/BcsL family acetyltransferase involved in cellulose biosynthesis